MGPAEVARQYAEAWNSRDPDRVRAMFTEDGTYEDPTTGGPLTGPAIAGYVSGMLAMLPDLSFDTVDLGVGDNGTVTFQWLMRGTNTGPLPSGPALGHTVALPGVDIIRVAGDKIASVTGYFDLVTTYRQLGLKAELLPAEALGPFSFGTATYAYVGSFAPPGALSFTAIEVRNEEERNEIRDRSTKVAMELLGMPGFIGFLGMVLDDRMFTVTAWEDAEAPARLRGVGSHSDAMRAFFNGELGGTGVTSLWAPERSRQHVACPVCGKVTEASRGACTNGHPLPPQRYF